MLWGTVAGPAGRLVMRLIAEGTATATTFSVAGTTLIVAFSVALPGALAAAYSHARWPLLLLGAGVGLLAAGDWVLIGLLLTAMAGVIAAQGVPVARTARRWAPAARHPRGSRRSLVSRARPAPRWPAPSPARP